MAARKTAPDAEPDTDDKVEEPTGPDDKTIERMKRDVVKAAKAEAKRAGDEAPKLMAEAQKERRRSNADEAAEIQSRGHACAERARTLADLKVTDITGIRQSPEGTIFAVTNGGQKLRVTREGCDVITGPGTMPSVFLDEE